MFNVSDLFEVKGKTGSFSYEYVEANGLEIITSYSDFQRCTIPCARSKESVSINKSKTINVVQADGSKRVAYLYGQYHWTYDSAEVEAYRAEVQKQHAINKAHRELLQQVQEKVSALNDNQLRILLEML